MVFDDRLEVFLLNRIVVVEDLLLCVKVLNTCPESWGPAIEHQIV